MLKSEGDEVGKKFHWPVCKGRLVVHGCMGPKVWRYVTMGFTFLEFGYLGRFQKAGGLGVVGSPAVWVWRLFGWCRIGALV